MLMFQTRKIIKDAKLEAFLPLTWLFEEVKQMRSVVVLVILLSICGVSSAQFANSPWPMLNHDPENTGYTTFNGTKQADVYWTYSFSNANGNAQAIVGDDGLIYIGTDKSKYGSSRGGLFILYPNGTLKSKWFGENNVAVPAIDENGSLYIYACNYYRGFCDNNYQLYAYYKNSTLKWKTSVPFAAFSASNVNMKIGSELYITSSKSVYSTYTNNGTQKWTFMMPDYIKDFAVDGNTTVYVGDQAGNLYAITSSGSAVWSYTLPSGITSIFYKNGKIFVGYSNNVSIFNSSGAVEQNITFSSNVYKLASKGNEVYVRTYNDVCSVYLNGTLKWCKSIGAVGSAGLVVDQNGIIYTTTSSSVVAFDPQGNIVWSYSTYQPKGISIGQDVVYIISGSYGRTLTALRDITPPEISINSPKNNTVYSTSTIQINASVTDPSGIDTVLAQIDGTTNITLTYQNGYYVGTVNLINGNHSIRIFANDTLGNMNSSVVVYFSVNSSQPSVIYVPDDYAKIKWAVENATAGSTIYVKSGTYSEYNINVTKSLSIIGLNYPTLTSPQDREIFYGFNVSANNVTIAGFNFSGFAGYVLWGNRYGTGIPIRVKGNDIRIENSTFGIYNGETNDYGILIENSKNVEIDNCSIFTSNLMSIEIRDSENVTMSNSMLMNSNNPWNNVNGIYILRSPNVTVYNNTLSINTVGVKDGIVVDSSDNCSVTDNRISGSGIDKAIVIGFSNGGGSSNCTIKDNIIKGTKFGIYVGTFSKHNLIENNTVRDVTAGYMGWCCYLGAYGIEIAGSNNVVLNNTIENSSYIGMVVDGCSDILRNNTMRDNFINFRYEADCSEPNDIDSSNTVDSKIIGYYYNSSNITLSSSNIGTVILERCSNVKLKDLTLSKNFYGALILKSENITLNNVTAVNNMKGITLEFSKDVRVNNCTAFNNYIEGMWIRQRGVANVTVENCNISENGNGIVVIGHHAYTNAWIVNISIVNNRIYNNTLDLLADWGNYGIVVDLANDVAVTKNEICENKDGIKLQSFASALIEDNKIYNNSESGIFISDNSYGDIFRNTVINNTYGVSIDKSNAYLEGNDVKSNKYGLHVYYSKTEGKFNYFHNNTIGIFSQLSTTNMSYSNIVNNSIGILFEEHWMHEGSGNFTFNNIVNYNYNFVNNETYNISAINNWWGTTNETLIELKILDYHDNNETGVVFYKPYLTEHLVFGIKGDFNYNGYVDIGDVVYVAHMVIGKIKPDSSADFNGNGRVDIGDLAKIAYYVIGKISEL